MNRKIILSLYIIIILLQGCASVNNHKDTSVINTTEQVQESHSEQTSESMMIPGNAQKSPSGYAYITLNQGNGIKPSDKDAVDIKIRALDFEGNVIDEGTGTLAMSHSTPFFEEMLSLMTIGETIRVWGESESRIWEIQMVSIDDLYSAPQDAGVIPDDAQLLSGFEDIYYKIVEPGTGDRISEGAALRIHGSRWKRNGEILESNRAGRGMLVLMTDEQKIADPIHHALFLEMNPGIHVRIWIPAKYENTDFDVVEDFWLTERLTQLETPMDFRAPENKENLIVIEDDVFIRFIEQKSETQLRTGDESEVEMTCWNRDTGQLIDATYLREKHDIMDISPELGIWEKIMISAGRGDSFMTWIDKSKLPESVQMGLTCRVQIF